MWQADRLYHYMQLQVEQTVNHLGNLNYLQIAFFSHRLQFYTIESAETIYRTPHFLLNINELMV